MKTELIIANKSSGKMWEISNSTPEITWTTDRTGSPGTLKFNVIKAGDLSFTEGDVVRFSVDGQLQFYGWVFTKDKDRWGEIQVTCYDRIRYLKANASYNFQAQTAGDMLRQIASDLQLDVGEVGETGYPMDLVEEDQSCLDILGEAVDQTLLNTGTIWVLYDDANGLALRRPEDMVADVLIGEFSLLTDYHYKTDIDSQTYNYVKLARPNEETGLWETFVAEDSAAIGQWGMLQLYQTVDGDVNDAQVRARAEATLSYYDRRMRTLKVESLGVLGLRAGMMVRMKVAGLGDINLDQLVLLEKVTHTWHNDEHTMTFETLGI